MEKVAELLKIFIEKHLIPAVISVAGAIIMLLALPHDFWMVVKLGNTLFIILSFCCIFLIVQIIICVGKSIKSFNHKNSENKYYAKQRNKTNQEAIQSINDFVDKLSPQEKELLVMFVVNGNKILLKIQAVYSFDSLWENDDIINCSRFSGDITCIDENKYWIDPSLKRDYSQGMRPVGELKQYKIKDALFHDLKLVYEQQGRLGNF